MKSKFSPVYIALAGSLFVHFSLFSCISLFAANWKSETDPAYVSVELIRPFERLTNTAMHSERVHHEVFREQPAPHPEMPPVVPMTDNMTVVNIDQNAHSPATYLTPDDKKDSIAQNEEHPAYRPFQMVSKIPSFKTQVKPVYPRTEKSAGVEARVIVEVYISAQGAVDDVKIVKSGGRLFDLEVISAVRNCSFEPGYADGKPVPMRVQIPYAFQLR